MFKKILIATAIATAPMAVQAADLGATQPVAAAPVFTWTGFYVGAHAGYGSKDATLTNSSPPGPPTRNVEKRSGGFVGGVQAGYDLQLGGSVVGVVADGSYVNLGGTFVNVPPPGPPFVATSKVDWLSTIRVRAGILVTPQALAYVHGGVAFGNVKGSWVGGPFNGQGGSTRAGWVLGGGLEYRLHANWSVFAEYSFADLGNSGFVNAVAPAVRFDHRTEVHTVKIGLNYRFGGSSGPIVAAY